MNNLQQLDEALNFLNNEDKSEVIEEGFFSKLKSLFNKGNKQKEKLPEYTYYVSSVEKSIGSTVKTMRSDKSLSDAIGIYLVNVLEIGNLNFGVLEIFKKNESKLSENIYVYKCKVIGVDNNKNYNIKIESIIYSGAASATLSKFNIKYKIIDTSSIEKERKAIRNKAIKIANDIIKEAKKLPEWDNCYSVYKDSDLDEDDIEFWNTGIENYIDIIDYDLDKYNGNKREYFGTKECSKMFDFIYGNFKKRVEAEINNASVDYYGDWDAGPIVIEIKK